jgi:hypothetical protein
VLSIEDTIIPLSGCLDVEAGRRGDVEDGPCRALKQAYGRKWWAAGRRP